MSELCTCHLLTSTVLFCISVERLGLAEVLQHHCPDIVVSSRTELEGRQ